MKKAILLTLMTALSTVIIAQINVEEYERKIVVDVSEVNNIPNVRAFSDCGEVTVKTKDTMMSGGCLGTMVRSYTFSDECGNQGFAEQYINLRDSEAPVLQNVPKDITVASNNVPKPANVTATDNVGDDDIKVEMTEFMDEENQQLVRQWRAVDLCGNASIAKQTITISGV